MRRTVAALLGALALAVPVADTAVAARATIAKVKPKQKVVTSTKTVQGAEGDAGRWGFVKVTLVVRKTTTTIGTKTKVARRITRVQVPEYPDHTDRSVFINQQALPILVQEVMQAQFDPNIEMVSGASDTSYAFEQSLQAALTAARKS